uniref:Nucleoside diphosphate-linked moiety X motif 8, mitochondrial n=1 Tax=Callorhinchus milii TaxID=7868 RepID=V9LEG2_CALMI
MTELRKRREQKCPKELVAKEEEEEEMAEEERGKEKGGREESWNAAVLFTRRSSSLGGRHRGDVCFPGGMAEEFDGDPLRTALRETEEELGVTVREGQVWGALDPITDRTGLMIIPFLANLGPIDVASIKANPREVEEVFAVALSELCAPENRGYTRYGERGRWAYTLPVFSVRGLKIWGVTALILNSTLQLLFPETYIDSICPKTGSETGKF